MSDIFNIHLFDINSYGLPPEPTQEEPFAQILWLFNCRRDRASSKDRKSAYIAARNRIVIYLQSIHGNKPFLLKEHIDEFFLVRLKQTLAIHGNVAKDLPKLKSHTLVGFLSSVRQVMLDAISYQLLSCEFMQNSSLGASQRETEVHTDYSDNELDQILNALSNEMRLVHKIISGYQPLKPGVGRDPRIRSAADPNAQYFDPGYGWKVIENLQWYFENVMESKPSFGSCCNLDKSHNKFYHHASCTHGGIKNVYKSWGVVSIVSSELIMPIVINLVYLTGLNPTSLLALSTDAYQDEHELTGMPYLVFEKKRSGGDLELHLSLLDSNSEIPLKRKQAINVKRAFDLLITLTKNMRDGLDEGDPLKRKLLIYESGSRVSWSKPIQLTPATTSLWCRAIAEKYDMRNDAGGRLDFNLVRFRSTKLTSMALEGRDLFEIQQVARHKNISTTLSYVNRNKVDIHIRGEVLEALQKIRENRITFTSDCNSTKEDLNSEKPVKFYKGLISDCKNTFDPPEWVKKSQDYVEGAPCVRFNMCLFCKNVIVLRQHLPVLAAYRAQLLSIQQNNIQNLPNAEHYDKTLELLNQLFDSDKSEFSASDIEWAIELSETIDVIVDPLIYHGVEHD
ncbi:hypothetical protein C3Y98_08785 [Methylotenera oryzisoli]|uniref:Tyr recombinase domain-containing protein n=1 Tax=Methylotenera oryzisoli TaxID=2080758 RepID=A0A4Y9VR97_9PROT|nr:site-specific integrase [Methylotenera oryzisoli]TFW70761.1 hypothetical protein C3Y98_08785 [Methylotenera oryzisoli]